MHEQHSLQLATLRDKLQNKIALDIPSLQLETQQNVSLQVARKVEASGTFRDVARQSAVCDMASQVCHATLTSTLRDTLREILYRVTLRLDVTTRDGTSSKSLIELVKSVTNDGVRYAAVFEMALHFPDGRKGLFIAEFVDSPVVEEVIDGDQVVAAVDHKDVCVNFLREFWQLMAHQVFLPLRDLLRAAGLAEGSEFLQLSVHSWS